MRLTIVAADGGVRRTISPDLSGAASFVPAFIGVTGTDHFVFRDDPPTASLRDEPTGERRDSIRYFILEPDGAWTDGGWTAPGTEVYFTNQSSQWGSAPVIFGRSSLETLRDGHLVVGNTDSLMLRQIGIDGSIKRTLSLPSTSTPVSPHWVEAERDQRLREIDRPTESLARLGVTIHAGLSGEQMNSWAEARIRSLPNRTTLPAFSALRADALGNTWIAEYAPPGVNERRWIVLNSSFKPVARINVAVRIEILDIGANFLAGRTRDELGRETVSLYRIVRRRGTAGS
jgi:hypothetical protein